MELNNTCSFYKFQTTHDWCSDTACACPWSQVVVDNDKTAKALLERGALTKRVTIIPLNQIRYSDLPANVVAAAQKLGAGRAAPAIELVGYEADVASAMKYAFGGAFVCEVGADWVASGTWLGLTSEGSGIRIAVGGNYKGHTAAKCAMHVQALCLGSRRTDCVDTIKPMVITPTLSVLCSMSHHNLLSCYAPDTGLRHSQEARFCPRGVQALHHLARGRLQPRWPADRWQPRRQWQRASATHRARGS